MHRWTAGFLALLLTAAVLAAGRPTPEQLEKQVNQRFSTMRDMHCNVKAKLKVLMLPVSVAGDVYYQAPNKVQVVLKNLPKELGTYQGAFAGAMPRDRSTKDYKTEVTGDEVVNDHPCWVVLDTPVNPDNNVKSFTTWLDKASLTIPKMRFLYRDGGSVEGTSDYDHVGSLVLPTHTHLVFAVSGISATADVTYTGYEVNQGVAAKFFTSRQ